MASHAPLMRTSTAPVFQHSTDGVARLANMSMSSAPRASQLSGSIIYPSTASLGSLTNASTITSPPLGGQVMATSNIINQKADASRSLYQICVALKNRLSLVPGFEDYMLQIEQREQEAGDAGGPVEGLWGLLRTGIPLLAIYNAIEPDEPLNVNVPSATDAKKGKLAIVKFVQGCSKELKIPPQEMFIVADLMGTDTSGFSKVLVVINLVLDIAQQRGLLRQAQTPYGDVDVPIAETTHMSYRDHIVRELVDTERKFVQDLENLHDLKKTLEQKGTISGDIAHSIFLNINTILDFQRRFLIRVETTNSMPPNRQEWGSPFVAYEDSFNKTYQPFIANQRKAAQIASQFFDKILSAQHPVACDFNTLDGFLLKPMQRLVKYPLLLKDLMKKTEDEAIKEDIAAGIEAAERVLQRANEAVNRDLLDEALEELVVRVDDWKKHRVEHFGKLLLHGVYTVITGKIDQERDYEIYLFECILLCCKEITPNKSKDKKDKTRLNGPKVRNKNAKLQLKGRIFMTNVTEVLSFSKPGSYTVQIWWKGDPGVENFVIKFQNEGMMKKWATGLDNQRKEHAPQNRSSSEKATANFRWMEAQVGDLINPYAGHDEEEDEHTPPTSQNSITGTMPRMSSSTSLRQRSGTQENIGPMAGLVRRQPPPSSFPLPQAPTALSLQTGPQPQPSPSTRGGESYFSPVAESPASSRTSATSSFFGQNAGFVVPKAGAPQSLGWPEEQNRYTAPAMPRAPSRDGPSPVYMYDMVNGRNPRGPSLPAMATSSSQSVAAQQRSRSYSTPDINGQPQQPLRRGERGASQGVPAVPGIPPHLHPAHDGSIPRSQTGSPRQELPIRANTQSPGVQRDRLQSQGHGVGGQMTQFPTQPLHRQLNPGPNNGLMPAPLNLDSSRIVPPGLSTAGTFHASNPLTSPIPNNNPLFQSQLKVKVNCDTGNYVTLVAAFNITYKSLIDRIDAKLSRFTTASISEGDLRLRYRDEDGDFVNIESDEDIQIAFSDWRENLRSAYSGGGMGEIELFCAGNMA